jgi:predicted PurR-regulated permease PerM
MNSVNINVSPRSIAAFISFVLLIWLIVAIKDVLLLLFASFIIASALYPIVDWMSKYMRRGFAVTIVYFVVFLLITVVSVPYIALFIEQTQEFIKDFHKYWFHIQQFISRGEVMLKSTGVLPDYSQTIGNLSTCSQDILNQSINMTVNLFVGIAMAFTLAFIVLFLLLDKQEIKKGILYLFPVEHREKTELIAKTISRKVGGYVRGQLLLMFLVGLLTSLILAVIGVDFAFLLGIIAGIMEIVPIIGPILAAVPAIIIALAKGPLFALIVLGVYLLVQRIENSILSPLILGRFLELHPIIIISAVLIASYTLGLFGVILSPAIAAAVYVLIQELYLKRINGQQS